MLNKQLLLLKWKKSGFFRSFILSAVFHNSALLHWHPYIGNIWFEEATWLHGRSSRSSQSINQSIDKSFTKTVYNLVYRFDAMTIRKQTEESTTKNCIDDTAIQRRTMHLIENKLRRFSKVYVSISQSVSQSVSQSINQSINRPLIRTVCVALEKKLPFLFLIQWKCERKQRTNTTQLTWRPVRGHARRYHLSRSGVRIRWHAHRHRRPHSRVHRWPARVHARPETWRHSWRHARWSKARRRPESRRHSRASLLRRLQQLLCLLLHPLLIVDADVVLVFPTAAVGLADGGWVVGQVGVAVVAVITAHRDPGERKFHNGKESKNPMFDYFFFTCKIRNKKLIWNRRAEFEANFKKKLKNEIFGSGIQNQKRKQTCTFINGVVQSENRKKEATTINQPIDRSNATSLFLISSVQAINQSM